MLSPQFIQFITYHLVVFEDFVKDVQHLINSLSSLLVFKRFIYYNFEFEI